MDGCQILDSGTSVIGGRRVLLNYMERRQNREHFMQIRPITECSDNWSDYEFVNLIGTVLV